MEELEKLEAESLILSALIFLGKSVEKQSFLGYNLEKKNQYCNLRNLERIKNTGRTQEIAKRTKEKCIYCGKEYTAAGL